MPSAEHRGTFPQPLKRPVYAYLRRCLDAVRFGILLGLALCANAAACLHAQSIEATPSQVPADEAATIRVTGLQPREHATIQAELVDGDRQPWASRADFAADDTGSIDTSKQAPLKGSYRIVSAMGLVWSMKPTGKNVHTYSSPRIEQSITLELMKGDTQIASSQLEQIFYPPDLTHVRVDGPLRGGLFLPATPGPHPGVLVLGGSEGGMPTGKAIWLASHGYAALALAYFRFPGLPQQLESIPLEYFGQALEWMRRRPEIVSDQLAVVGTSRGGELALQLGALYPELRAVVAYVPANVRNQSCCSHNLTAAWTWKGRPLPFELSTSSTDNPLDPAAIYVERTNGAILMISGGADGIWSSSTMAEAAMHRLQIAHFVYRFEHLRYPHAGHGAGEPWIMPTWTGGLRHPVSGEPEDMGGTPEGNARSTIDADPKVLDFLQQNLSATLHNMP